MTTESLLTGTEPTSATSTTTATETTTASTTPATGDPAATTAAPDTTTAKPEGEGAATTADGKSADEKIVEGAPEKYADFKAPEGQELAPDVAVEVGTLAKELNLSQDKAQKVFDTAAKLAAKGVEAQVAAITTTRADWVSQVKADKEFVAGPGLEANLATAKAAMLATTNPQFQTLLARSGLGDHPDVIRHFLKIAPAFAEDKHVPGGKAPAGDSKSAEKVLYPNNA